MRLVGANEMIEEYLLPVRGLNAVFARQCFESVFLSDFIHIESPMAPGGMQTNKCR